MAEVAAAMTLLRRLGSHATHATGRGAAMLQPRPTRRDWRAAVGACMWCLWAAMPGTMEIGVQGMGVGPANAERAVVPVVPPG